MNPDTRQLELVEQIGTDLVKEVIYPPEHPARKPPAAVGHVALRQLGDPVRNAWTTFSIGEKVEVIRRGEHFPISRILTVRAINADGLLLRGSNLGDSFFVGQDITVKGEKCRVHHLSSKGMYVRGAS